MSAPQLRDYQVDIIDRVNRLTHPLIPLPTGGGKTVIAAAIIKETAHRGKRVLFIVHRRELVLQASANRRQPAGAPRRALTAKLLDNEVDHAILMGAESSEYIGQRCIVASIATPSMHALSGPRESNGRPRTSSFSTKATIAGPEPMSRSARHIQTPGLSAYRRRQREATAADLAAICSPISSRCRHTVG